MLSERYEDALIFATRLHSRQVRKGSRVPYITHLLTVSALVLEDRGSEDEAIAALLHDAIEDQGGDSARQEILRRFGPNVARIVEGCTDADTLPKPPWRERKEAYLAHLYEAPADVRRVSAADKLHNARCVVRDYREQGEVFWSKFKGGKDGTLWYFHELVKVFQSFDRSLLVDELARTVAELDQLAGRNEG